MKMLGISTSAKAPSAALLLDDGRIAFREDLSGRPHSVSLMVLVDELFADNALEPSDIDVFAVDIGPGSFTGVRIGVSTVNAMACALKKPVVAVPSLSAMRHLAKGDAKVLVMLDARNGNGYAAAFEWNACILKPCACVQNEVLAAYEGAELVGDCCGKCDQCSAKLVIEEALSLLENEGEGCKSASAVPMYLRPSQAERMKGPKA